MQHIIANKIARGEPVACKNEKVAANKVGGVLQTNSANSRTRDFANAVSIAAGEGFLFFSRGGREFSSSSAVTEGMTGGGDTGCALINSSNCTVLQVAGLSHLYPLS